MRTSERRDSRGRRIGYNWWREHCVSIFRDAHDAWLALRESAQEVGHDAPAGATSSTAYYQLSDSEYQAVNPRPTLKAILMDQKGLRDERE